MKRLIDHWLFGLLVVLLILISVSLIITEIFVQLDPDTIEAMHELNTAITVFFLFELLLRWTCSRTTGLFLRNHWIDVLAVIPLLRVFRLGRIFKIVTLLRIFSLGTVFHRRMAVFARIFEGRVIEYGVIAAFLAFALIFGTIGYAQFEIPASGEVSPPPEAMWKALFSLLSSNCIDYPATIGGRIVFAALSLISMTVFAMMTGTVSAIMIDKLKESAMHRHLDPEELDNHLVICGFSKKVDILVANFSLDPRFRNRDILLVSTQAHIDDLRAAQIPTNRVQVLREDFTRVDTLKRAAIERAAIAIVLSEAGENRSTEDIDARTLLAALTIERLNPDIHTCAEIYHREYMDHLRMGGVENIVVQHEVSGSLLARIAMNEGVLTFFRDLLDPSIGNDLILMPPPPDLVGRDIGEVTTTLKQRSNTLVVGVRPANAEMQVNPARHPVKADDMLLVITPATR